MGGHSDYPHPNGLKLQSGRNGAQQSQCMSLATVKDSRLRTSNIKVVTHKRARYPTISLHTAPFSLNIQFSRQDHRKPVSQNCTTPFSN
jgi:hypothetical protein